MSNLNRLTKHPLFQRLLPYQSLQSERLGFIDVGARYGAHELVAPIASHTAVLGFEPDEEEYQRLLQDPAIRASWAKFELEAIALGDKSSDAKLHLLSTPTNHSLLLPNTDFTDRYNMVKWQLIGSHSLQTEKLDTILFGKRSHENHWGELIKLDTQGSEYEILQGSEKMLTERTVAIVSEVSFCEVYQKQKLFSEIELFLRERGFTFYGFHSMHSRSLRKLNKLNQIGVERAMYADAVFFKDPLPGSIYQKPLSTRQDHLLFICALLLKYYDFALELAAKTWAFDLPEQLEIVKALIVDLSAKPYQETVAEILQLAENVNSNPARANLYAGKFSDKRRTYYDYDDVIIE